MCTGVVNSIKQIVVDAKNKRIGYVKRTPTIAKVATVVQEEDIAVELEFLTKKTSKNT